MATTIVRVTQLSQIKAGPEGGDKIGDVYAGTVLVVELSLESPHDGWYHIVGPNPPINADGTYLRTKKQGWIEVAHTKPANAQLSKIVIDIDWDAHSWIAREG